MRLQLPSPLLSPGLWRLRDFRGRIQGHLDRLSRDRVRTTVDDDIAVGARPTWMSALIYNLRIHRCANTRLHMLTFRFAYSAEHMRVHLVRRIARIEFVARSAAQRSCENQQRESPEPTPVKCA